MKNILYFDLETQRSADEVGGWDHISRMGMSVGVTYNCAGSEYRIYGEQQVDDLIKELQRADLIVGFNNLRFDYEVLHGYTAFDLRQLPTLRNGSVQNGPCQISSITPRPIAVMWSSLLNPKRA